jgi:predicted dienelactone hydrolase
MPNLTPAVSIVAASVGVFVAAALFSNSTDRSLLPAAFAQNIPETPTAPLNAVPSSIAPQFTQVDQYSITIADRDPADIYFPVSSNRTDVEALPIALLLPGALVSRNYYSRFARAVAQYGFVVVVPSHERSLPDGSTGELAEVSQVNAVLTQMTTENTNPQSPIAGRIDTQKLVLLGHSHGGAVGLNAIANVCAFPFCTGEFARPNALVAGIFYGVNTYDPTVGEYRMTNNAGIPVALVQGSRDGIATPEEANNTYVRIQDTPKALITVEGANHYGITDCNNPLGAVPDASSPTLKQTQSIETIARWSALFLRAHALNDADAIDYLYQTGDALDDAVTVISHPRSAMQSSE